ncbi:MAG: VCBS repeat-containing protein [Cyclobacteriaceae bacterium]
MKAQILCIFLLCLISLSGQSQNLFENVASANNVNIDHHIADNTVDVDEVIGTGAAWFDMDGDGDLDLYVTQRVGRNFLFRNNRIGSGTENFTDVTSGDALDEQHDGAGVAVADYDNDGDQDIYLANSDGDVLLQNDGTGVFTDITAIAFPESTGTFQPGRGTTASWGDINNDGWLDLYVGNYASLNFNINISRKDGFYLNNGSNNGEVTFSDISNKLDGDNDGDGVVDNTAYSFGAIFTDFDNDGDLDLYNINDCPFGPEDNKLWRNDGDLSFTEVSTDVGPRVGGKTPGNGGFEAVSDCQSAMGIAVGDPDRNGLMDYYFTNITELGQSMVFLVNDGQQLNNLTKVSGLFEPSLPDSNEPWITWAPIFIDYDLDGWQDLAMTAGNLELNGQQPNILYKNTGISSFGTAKFERLDFSRTGIEELNEDSRTLSLGDYDMDGDPDLYMVNFGGEARLYKNTNANGFNWMIVEAEGAGPPLTNKNGIGCRVKTYEQSGNQSYEIRSGSGLGSGDDIAAYFGLGGNNQIGIEISWPSGIIQRMDNVSSNQRIRFREPDTYVYLEMEDNPLVEGQVMVINWKSTFDEDVKIELYEDGKKRSVISSQEPNTGQYEWVVENNLKFGSEYSFLVNDVENKFIPGRSPGIVSQSISGIEYAEEDVLLYPNPTTSRINIKYDLKVSGNVRISICDIHGRSENILDTILPSGTNTFIYDFNESSCFRNTLGLYFFKIQMGKQLRFFKVLRN